jgi:hypothetical protein
VCRAAWDDRNRRSYTGGEPIATDVERNKAVVAEFDAILNRVTFARLEELCTPARSPSASRLVAPRISRGLRARDL